VALVDVFSSAMAGKSKDRPELVDKSLPLTVSIPVLPCRGGEAFLRGLFEPLGYQWVIDVAELRLRFCSAVC
jgi:hypothetical protein